MFFIIKKEYLILYSAVILFTLGSLFAYAKHSAESYPGFDKTTVIIDPGHGGLDGGAVGKNGTLEKDLNLALSLELKDMLSKNGFDVIMTREEDKMLGKTKKVDTKERLMLAKKNPEALYVGIHMNSFEDATSKGSQIFYSTKNPQSKIFAGVLKNNFLKTVDSENKRQNKEAFNTIYIMRNIENPAVLIECGFLSNRTEEQKLNSREYRAKIEKAITESIIAFSKQNNISAR